MVPVRSKKQMIQRSVVMCRTLTLAMVQVMRLKKIRTIRARKRRKGPKTASLLSTPPDSARRTRINKRVTMIRTLTTNMTGPINNSEGGKPGGRTFKTTTIRPRLNTAVKLMKSTAARSKKRGREGRSTSRLSSESAKSTKSV